jgi:cytochrome c
MSNSPKSRTLQLPFICTIILLVSACEQSSQQPPSHANDSKVDEISEPTNDSNMVNRFEIGEELTEQVLKGWDIDVRPDGMGLPKGSGSVEQGEIIYDDKCASCHGSFGEGEGRWPVLAGGVGSLTDERPTKTVGSYWPYASTLWDYINRAMPFTAPQSLETDEVYALTAYVLNLNDIVDSSFVLTQQNLAKIEMPNRDGFYADTRPDTLNPRCMSNCTNLSQVTIKQAISGITPEQTDLMAQQTIVNGSSDELLVIDDENTNLVGKATYTQACASCHDNGLAGAPVTGNKQQWLSRIAGGTELLYRHAIEGFNAMPAKGGQTAIKDENIRNAVDYMVLLSSEIPPQNSNN